MIEAKGGTEPSEHGVTRRRFVGLTIGGGAALLAGRPNLLRAATAANAENNSMFKIGGDLPVNRLGFGAMRITGEGIWGWPKDRDEARRVVKRAVELGVDLIDTADAYGPDTSELLIAEALRPYPKGIVIATKGGLTRPGPGRWVPNGRPEYLKACVDGSLKRLRLERIDLYQLHRVDPKVPMEDSLGAIGEMRDAGKIRHIGLSEVGPEEIERARRIVPIATVQNQYNVENRRWENALKYCEKEGLGFMPWSPVGGGRGLKDGAMKAVAQEQNASVYQVAIAWLLSHSAVMLPIPGTSSVTHLEENVAAGKLQLTPAQMKSLDAV
ncbi:MAG: aldo/keto reductase [Chthoniobacterales bacterium]|jgi:aryl-alcohol dehydrogenase-like predicted oxidoreductase|nr:aldo/keto reductase [Chthoniobacterales bacterium]MBA3763559.1 aldo/keto reductase [Chthoniobacterales bacterium]